MGQIFSLCNLQREEEEITVEVEKDEETKELTERLVASVTGIEKDVEKRYKNFDKEAEKHKIAALQAKNAGKKAEAILNMSKYKAAMAAKAKEGNNLAMLFNQKISIDSFINNILIRKRLSTATNAILSRQVSVEAEEKLQESTLDVQDAKSNIEKMELMMKTMTDAFSQNPTDSVYQNVESDDNLFKELEALEVGLDLSPKEEPVLPVLEVANVNRRNGSDPPPLKEGGSIKSVYHDSIEQRPTQKTKTKKKPVAMLA